MYVIFFTRLGHFYEVGGGCDEKAGEYEETNDLCVGIVILLITNEALEAVLLEFRICGSNKSFCSWTIGHDI